MSTQHKQDQQRRRDEETRLNVSHLAQASATTKEDDEDWGDVPAPKSNVTTAPAQVPQPQKTDLDHALEDDEDENLADDDLERELEEEDEDEEGETVNETREVPVARVEGHQAVQASMFDGDSVMRQIEQLQNNLPALKSALEGKLKEIESQRAKLDANELGIKSRINFLRVLSGQQPLTVEEKEEEAPRRRGRRKSANSGESTQTPATTPSPVTPVEGERPRGRGGRGKRHHNDQTLKQAICKAMTRMVHPTTGKAFTGFVNDITVKVMKEEGYKSTSAKPTNTVRIQMYRLEDEGKVRQNEDNSYTLRKNVVRELGIDPDVMPVTTTTAS